MQNISERKTSIKSFLKLLRVHQYIKNILLFIPILAAHKLNEPNLWVNLIFAFFAFSLCASSVYITNDLFDLDNDRRHSKKKHRPLASGAVELTYGILAIPILIIASAIIAGMISTKFLLCLIGYWVLTSFYTFTLKKIVLIDCLTLAMLYTARIFSGAVVISTSLSFWLLAFSVFLFLSLAFIKRYAELNHKKDSIKLHGRGYYPEDKPLIEIMGVSSGFMAALVLAFYLNSPSVLLLYRSPESIWATVPVLLFWINWMWVQTHRGQMHDDPIVYAVTDKTSIFSGFLFVTILLLGSIK